MNLTPDRRLGEYQLRELLTENDLCYRWLAEQLSIARLVLLDELRLDQDAHREAFLADVRAKAAIDHPLISSVYEAVSEPTLCYYTHELLAGPTLADHLQANECLRPADLTHILRRISEAYLQHETLAHATSALGLDAVHRDQHGVIRIANLAIAGERHPEESTRDIFHLGTALVPLVAAGHPGASRLLTLLGWMRGLETETPLTWAQIREFCLQIEQQLADPVAALAAVQETPTPKKSSSTKFLLLALIPFLAVAAAVFYHSPKTTPPQQVRAKLPEPIIIPAGAHPTPDGGTQTLSKFRIAATEVTIGEYSEFLDTLEKLASDGRQSLFDAPGQPAEKTSHLPSDWAALFSAAKNARTWNQLPVTLDSPVTGIDWWDAAAYADFKQARLPSQDEWFAALHYQTPDPKALTPCPWVPFSPNINDRTPSGLIGMAGSLCEWTRDSSPNPSNPLGDQFWVIIGGSYLKTGSGALSREWVADRSVRREDLGFRLAYDGE
jgi:hypothetical protein